MRRAARTPSHLLGTGTPSAVVFKPGPAAFERPHHAGTFSTPKTITLTNRTSGPLTIARVHLGGQNPEELPDHRWQLRRADDRGGRDLHGDCPVRAERGRDQGRRPLGERRRAQRSALRRSHRHVDLPQGRRRRPRRGRLRRDEDHVSQGRVVAPVRSHGHRPQPDAHPDRAERRDAAPARCRRPARSRAQALLGLRVPGVRALSLAHAARDTEPLARDHPAPPDRRDLHAHGRRRHQRHDTDRLVAQALDALRLLVPALPRAATRSSRSDPCTPRRSRSAAAGDCTTASRTRSSCTRIRPPIPRARRSGARRSACDSPPYGGR